MRISHFFRDVLGAELKHVRQSWGAQDQATGRIYLRVWRDQIQKKGKVESVRVYWKKPHSRSSGFKERRAHLDAMRRGAEGYGVVCVANDPNRKDRTIKEFDEQVVLRLGEIVETRDFEYAQIIERIPLDRLRRQSRHSDWSLKPGDNIRRKNLHRKFGGRSQGGIGPSAKTPNVFLFSDPTSGEQHGYIDQWQADGCFHYTGEGQRGDQRFAQGNRAVLNTLNDGRALRLFNGTGGIIEYVDEMILDPNEPYYLSDAPETGGGPIRSIIIFKLIPVNINPNPDSAEILRMNTDTIERVPVESQHTEKAYIDPSREEYEAERRESIMVQKYKRYMEKKGHLVERLRITPKNEAKPMFCDVYVKKLGLLIEAKGSTDRQSIRMAIGQLIDYRRFVSDSTECAVLLPSRPRSDLIDLIESAGMRLIYEDDNKFVA